MKSICHTFANQSISLRQCFVWVSTLGIISVVCSCSSEKIEPTKIGRFARQNSSGNTESGTEGRGKKLGGAQNSESGTGNSTENGTDGKNQSDQKNGADNNSTDKEIKDAGTRTETVGNGSEKPAPDSTNRNNGKDAGKDTTAKTGKGENSTPQNTPAVFPGRLPKKPSYSVAVALEMAEKALNTSRRARATGALSSAYKSASEAYNAVLPYAGTDRRCREKSDEISDLLELLANEKQTPPDSKPTIFQ